MTPPDGDRTHQYNPFRGCLAVLFVLIGLAIAAVVIWIIVGRNSLNARKGALQVQGMPTTLEELDAFYTAVPDDENAALIYLDAVDAFRNVGRELSDKIPIVYGQQPMPDLGTPLDPAVLDAAQRLLEVNAETLRLAHEAAAYPRARYPIDLTRGPQVNLPHLANIRNLARLLALHANVKAQQGDTQGATESIVAILGLAHSLSNEPILVSQLVRVAVTGIAAEHFARVVSLGPLEPDQLDAIDAAFAGDQNPETFARALIGERTFALDAMPASNLAAKWLFAFDRLERLRQYGALIAAIRQDTPTMHRAFDAAENYQPTTFRRFTAPLTSILLPALGRTQYAFLRKWAQADAVRCIAAIETYRLDTGQLPESLGALVPNYLDDLPIDPYTEQPLIYRTLDPGYVVYSVGPNETDDGGEPLHGGISNGDFALRIAR